MITHHRGVIKSPDEILFPHGCWFRRPISLAGVFDVAGFDDTTPLVNLLEDPILSKANAESENPVEPDTLRNYPPLHSVRIHQRGSVLSLEVLAGPPPHNVCTQPSSLFLLVKGKVKTNALGDLQFLVKEASAGDLASHDCVFTPGTGYTLAFEKGRRRKCDGRARPDLGPCGDSPFLLHWARMGVALLSPTPMDERLDWVFLGRMSAIVRMAIEKAEAEKIMHRKAIETMEDLDLLSDDDLPRDVPPPGGNGNRSVAEILARKASAFSETSSSSSSASGSSSGHRCLWHKRVYDVRTLDRRRYMVGGKDHSHSQIVVEQKLHDFRVAEQQLQPVQQGGPRISSEADLKRHQHLLGVRGRALVLGHVGNASMGALER